MMHNLSKVFVTKNLFQKASDNRPSPGEKKETVSEYWLLTMDFKPDGSRTSLKISNKDL